MRDLEHARALACALQLAIIVGLSNDVIDDGEFGQSLLELAADLADELLDSAGTSPALVLSSTSIEGTRSAAGGVSAR